jgi:hypothetical protein
MAPRKLSRIPVLAVLFTLTPLSVVALTRADESAPPKKILAEQSRKHMGQWCVVTFLVKSTKHAVKRNRYYVDSQADFRDPHNLGIQIEEPMAAKICQSLQVDDLATFLEGKTIRVTGGVFLQDDLPYIKVSDSADLVVVEAKNQGQAASTPRP